MKSARIIISIMLVLSILVTTINVAPIQIAEAASQYITAEAFAEKLAVELNLAPVSGSTSSGYVNALMENGIIKSEDVAEYNSYLTRGDALVFLNRADEYLYGDNLSEKLVQLTIDKRISDINNIKAEKRTDVAKAYLKGYMKGYSNGNWSTDRNMKVTSKITKDGALSILKMIHNPSLRAKISPDGQLIRTTNLPYSYEKFPYILASYPNEYYDWMLEYELSKGYKSNGKSYEYVNLVDYASPADIDRITPSEDMTQYDIAEIKEKHLDTLVNKVQTYLELIFNVNYKTIDENWIEDLLKTDYTYGQHNEYLTRDNIKEYIKKMKENKTIVEYGRINVDPSSLYYFSGFLYIRANVKYRIISSKVGMVDIDTIIKDRPYKSILWTRDINVNFTDFTLGQWRECGFDISLGSYTLDLNDIGVFYAHLDEFLCKEYPVLK